ncbi:MAG: hypothetical protein F6K56_38245 [Moorea sp. SIO3G5]|nr:hypothetical protein [Moorena sp. SIO3G5]
MLIAIFPFPYSLIPLFPINRQHKYDQSWIIALIILIRYIQFSDPHSRLPIPYSLFPIPYSLFPVPFASLNHNQFD